MQRVRLFHWKAVEASPLVELLRAKGYTVDYAGESANGNFRSLRETPPMAAIIDLSRLPSHGRYVAGAIRGTKSVRHLPIVFVDGETEKVDKLRREIPDAVFTSRARLVSTLKRVKPVANPVIPPRIMDSYAGRTAAEKLGIRKDSRVALLDPAWRLHAGARQTAAGCIARRRSRRGFAADAVVYSRSGCIPGSPVSDAICRGEEQAVDFVAEADRTAARFGSDAAVHSRIGAGGGVGRLQNMLGE